jgi:hydroxyacylglutathione hydrolase
MLPKPTRSYAGSMRSACESRRSYASDERRLPGFTDGLEEGDRVAIGGLEAEVLFIPAHTSGHIAYVFDDAVFCGDTLFVAGCGRLFEGTAEMMYEALNVKLSRLADDVRVFCGHEYTRSNLDFALHVEPANRALQEQRAWVDERRSKAAPDWHDATDAEMTVPSTLREERATNPFMRVDSAEIQESVRKQYGECPSDPAQILGRLRAMKDGF